MIEAPDHLPDLTRLKIFAAAIVAMLGVIVFRLWYLQIASGDRWAGEAESQRYRLIRRVAPRGAIVDAKGRVLATSRPQFVVSVIPDELRKNPDVLPRLYELLKVYCAQEEIFSPEALKADIESRRTTASDPVPLVVDADNQLLAQIEEQRLDLPGVLVTKDPIRYYNDGGLCTHVLGIARPITPEALSRFKKQGYRGGDNVGVEGLEKVYESELRGTEGGQKIAVDARGRMQRSVEEIKPIPGHTLRLTIDKTLQWEAMSAFKDLANGRPASAVAIEPNTGAVLALVNTPTYDLNAYTKNYKQLSHDPMKPLVNRAVNGRYPCGSTIKLVTATAALQSGTISPYTSSYCSGAMEVGKRVFHCDKRSGHGPIGFTQAVAASCNIYFWHAAENMGRDNLILWAKRFGLGQTTGIDLPRMLDAKGQVPTPQWKKKTGRGVWFPGDTLNMAIGQGNLLATPLQLANFTAAIANGGQLMKPTLVREIDDVSGPTPKVLHRLNPQVRGELGLSPANRAALISGMEQVFAKGGTAYGLAIPGLRVAGKTGTAQVSGHTAHSVFVAFAPVEKPQIAVAVLVENGGHGAEAAAPIARRILAKFFEKQIGKVAPVAGIHNNAD